MTRSQPRSCRAGSRLQSTRADDRSTCRLSRHTRSVRSQWLGGGFGCDVLAEDGSAIIEFIFVAIVIFVPLVYLIVAVAVVQRSRLATTNAARDVGRAIATANSADAADERADAALRIALASDGLRPDEVQLRFVGAASDCQNGVAIIPQLSPDSEFAVCVIRRQPLPAVPTVLTGRGVTTIGRFVVHVDDYRVIGR